MDARRRTSPARRPCVTCCCPTPWNRHGALLHQLMATCVGDASCFFCTAAMASSSSADAGCEEEALRVFCAGPWADYTNICPRAAPGPNGEYANIFTPRLSRLFQTIRVREGAMPKYWIWFESNGFLAESASFRRLGPRPEPVVADAHRLDKAPCRSSHRACPSRPRSPTHWENVFDRAHRVPTQPFERRPQALTTASQARAPRERGEFRRHRDATVALLELTDQRFTGTIPYNSAVSKPSLRAATNEKTFSSSSSSFGGS